MTTHAPARASMGPASWLAAALVALTGAAPALAQAPTENARAFITINGGLQALTTGFSENVVFMESGGEYPKERGVISDAAGREQARFESDYRFENSTLFDVSGGVRVWSYFGVGVGVSRFSWCATSRKQPASRRRCRIPSSSPATARTATARSPGLRRLCPAVRGPCISRLSWQCRPRGRSR